MTTREDVMCPECAADAEPLEAIDRRNFIRVVGGCAATALVSGGAVSLTPAPAAARALLQQQYTPPAPHPAEALVRELHAGRTADQRRQLVLPWNSPNRLRTYNAAMNARIGQAYTRPQQEMVTRIMRAISSGDDGYQKL